MRNLYGISILLAMLVINISASFAEESGTNNLSLKQDKFSDYYWFAGMVNNHPFLKNAEDQINSQINRTFRLVAPGFSDVKTFKDQSDDMMIWTPFVGLGIKLSKRWDMFAQTGYTAGSVQTKATDMSLLILPLKTNVEFKRSSFYAGIATSFYPWGMPKLADYKSFSDKLKNVRPFLAAGVNWNYQHAETNVKAGSWVFDALLHKTQKDSWRDLSGTLFVGMEVPLGKLSSLCLNGAYNHFFKYDDDFSGPSFSIYWKRRF